MSAHTVTIEARGITDVGRRRDHNEDALLVDEGLGLFVVADGMGGHAGGGTASRLAVETIRRAIREAKEREPHRFGPSAAAADDGPPAALVRALEAASALIHRTAQGSPGLAGMGTTVTAALIVGRTGCVAHVGDSRCYLLRGGRIYQVSEDHSLVNEQVKAGAISPEEARRSRFKNIITRSVGFEERVEVDLVRLELGAGDVLVICSDGLSNLVEDAEILRVVEEGGIDAAPRRLVELANRRGGDDNVTVIAVGVREP